MNKADMDIVVSPELLETEELDAIRISAQAVFQKIRSFKQSDGVLNFGESIWPAVVGREGINPELILVPLSRLGAVQGFSGNRVLIGYFATISHSLIPSRPMVIKLSPKRDAKKLEDERDRASRVRLHLAYYPGEFALPIHYDTVSDYGVLWSPFSSSTPLLRTYTGGTGSRLALGIEDLWYHLRKQTPFSSSAKLSETEAADPARAPAKDIDVRFDRNVDLKQGIETAFELLKPLHFGNGTAKRIEREVVTEYKRYLRGAEGDWGVVWNQIWAPNSQKTVDIDGSSRLNPFWVLNEIGKKGAVPLYCGGVHGDLHPKNILFSDHKTPHIIDFGWADPEAHIAKDFVLMECNLRFMVLRPEISKRHIEQLANWVGIEDACPKLSDDYCQSRADLIDLIRKIAMVRFPSRTDWVWEYVVPMFLTALGLLKHLRDTDNQQSALTTVISSGEYVAKRLGIS
jgi:hypothetical protein